MSNSTRSPSERLRKPSALMAVWWTKQSFSPFSGVMNPKPFASLNHFTVPVVRMLSIPFVFVIGTRHSHVYRLPVRRDRCPHAGLRRSSKKKGPLRFRGPLAPWIVKSYRGYDHRSRQYIDRAFGAQVLGWQRPAVASGAGPAGGPLLSGMCPRLATAELLRY